MASHTHTLSGFHWRCLTSIDSPEERGLFEQGRRLYDRLFTDDIKEDYAHFEEYIQDNAEERLQPVKAEVISTLVFGYEAEQMKGFVYYDWYIDWGLVFISYLGFDKTRSSRFFNTVPDLVITERAYLGLSGKPIRAAIFEIERYEPINLLDKENSEKYCAALKRAQRIRRFQRIGAWLIPWANYKQPPLEKSGRPVDMFLMYWPTGPMQREDPGTFTRDEIVRLVRFAYEHVYLDGYMVTEPKHDWPYWRALMNQYVIEASRYIPNTPIQLEKVATDISSEHVFVSYPSADEDKASIIAYRLITRGFPIKIWSDGAYTEGEGRVGEAIQRWMKEATHIIFLITPNSANAEGQIKEIEIMLRSRGNVDVQDVQIVANIPHDEIEKLGLHVTGWDGIIYHRFTDNSDFPVAVDYCVRSILSRTL